MLYRCEERKRAGRPPLGRRGKKTMPVTDFLERNSKLYGNEIALVELNPEMTDNRRITWKDYALMQPTSPVAYRREITWKVFDEKANRFANLLLSRGVNRGG